MNVLPAYKPAGYSWPLRLIYALLFIITKIALRIYYRRVTVIGKEHMPDDGATILISNHPNTLLDPLQVASRIKRQVFFLANAGLFQHKHLGPILRTFYCIPIERPQDVEGRAINNEKNFLECYLHLYNNGVIYIAPEGVSVQARTKLPLKTGTARIALGCVDYFHLEQDVKIVPVGLHYSAPLLFRSDVVIKIGKPISTLQWIQQHQEINKVQHSKLFTQYLQQELELLKITARDEKEEDFLKTIETIAHTDTPKSLIQEDQRSQNFLDRIQSLSAKEYDQYIQLCADYQRGLTNTKKSDFQMFGRKPWWKILLTLLLAPLGIWGILQNLPAFGVPFLLRKVSKVHASYNATVQFLAGIFTIPIFYFFQTYLFSKFFEDTVSWIYLFSLPVLGWIGWEWYLMMSKYLLNSASSPDSNLADIREQIKNKFSGFF